METQTQSSRIRTSRHGRRRHRNHPSRRFRLAGSRPRLLRIRGTGNPRHPRSHRDRKTGQRTKDPPSLRGSFRDRHPAALKSPAVVLWLRAICTSGRTMSSALPSSRNGDLPLPSPKAEQKRDKKRNAPHGAVLAGQPCAPTRPPRRRASPAPPSDAQLSTPLRSLPASRGASTPCPSALERQVILRFPENLLTRDRTIEYVEQDSTLGDLFTSGMPG